MLPRIVLHKQNGHRPAPVKPELTPNRVLLLAHSARRAGNAPWGDLLRFATLVRSEKPRAFVEQAARQIDGLRLSISEVLARTQAAFDRGELADVRATIDSIRTQSEAAASLVRGLMGSLSRGVAEQVAVDVPTLIEQTLEAFRSRFESRATLVTRIDPKVPHLMGNPKQLQQALAIFVTFVAETIIATGAPGRLVLEVVDGDAPGQAHRRVEVRIGAEGPEAPADTSAAAEPIDVQRDTDLSFACHVITAHRGVVSGRRLEAGRVAFVLELPAV